MMEIVKGRYHRGKIELDQPLDLQDGTEVEVSVRTSSAVPDEIDAFAGTAGSWAGNVPDDFEEQVYADRQRGMTRSPARW